jgi:hypothetical protein
MEQVFDPMSTDSESSISADTAALSSATVTAPAGIDLAEFLARSAGDCSVFSSERLSVLDRLSRRILTHAVLRTNPAFVALAFWLRNANLTRLRERFESREGAGTDVVIVPAGRVFHIAPANVDTLFVYSWALSFLCGNRNVVRLSTRTAGPVGELIQVIGDLMASEPLLAADNAFVQYGRSRTVNDVLSMWCSHRIVWGGDETVNVLRRTPLPPYASERAFASKYSWSVVKSAAWLSAGAEQRARTAERFFNDVFWFDQMACSSPQTIFWIGTDSEMAQATREFDEALSAVVRRKTPEEPEVAVAVQRRNRAFSLATAARVRFDPGQSGFTSVVVRDHGALDKEICGGGFLIYAGAPSLLDTVKFVTSADQTVTHFGFTSAELREFAVAAGTAGLDRIVPAGEALDFSPDWDGYNLLRDFIRAVVVRC